mmetsp:Transcript_10131/g.22801  ORF Transcript_10131/g.22801 Transcript_10131/m.22801 type:complete len:306 (+) Transcript_10131:102-1019(+)
MGRGAAFLLLICCSSVAVSFAKDVEECWPSWYDPDSDESSSDQCPFGKSLPGSVTWHDDMNPWLRAFNVWYGYTAFWCPFFVGALVFIMRGSRELLYGVSLLILSLWNEFVLKNIIKDPKPEEQCSITCGMPSGHAAIVWAMFTMYALDYFFRLDWKAPCSCAKLTKALLLVETGRINGPIYEALLIFWGIMLLPVPLARVLNQDHTWEQVLWGSIEGLFWGATTYWIHWVIAFTCCYPCKWPSHNEDGCWKDGCCNGQGCGYLVRHNIVAPYWTKTGAEAELALLENEDEWGCAVDDTLNTSYY